MKEGGPRQVVSDDSFERAFDGLLSSAYRISFRILGSVAEAEDAAAEAVARALVQWARIGGLPYRDAWVMKVAANVAIDMVRRRRAPLPPPAAADDESEATVLRVTMVAALSQLPRREREVIALRHLGGFSERDIAEALGITTNSVKTHGDRAMQKLRRRFGASVEAHIA
jgi:RNA polymerase sigma-70 factor (ECF subfamily)